MPVLPGEASQLLELLREVSQRGWLPAIGNGAPAIGMTLLDQLGVAYSSQRKPTYRGIVITASHRYGSFRGNRVNLFARVPDWDLSVCKSSAEIADRYGYDDRSGDRRLYCTVRARYPNTQGLFLDLNRESQQLNEIHEAESRRSDVASWRFETLATRLLDSHPRSMWVGATTRTVNGERYFHYRTAAYTQEPDPRAFFDMIQDGAITVDHLIAKKSGRVTEKGPLFKVRFENMVRLFGPVSRFDLI